MPKDRPRPQTLHPEALHPKACTLKPCKTHARSAVSLHPEPDILHLNPKPCSLNPKGWWHSHPKGPQYLYGEYLPHPYKSHSTLWENPKPQNSTLLGKHEDLLWASAGSAGLLRDEAAWIQSSGLRAPLRVSCREVEKGKGIYVLMSAFYETPSNPNPN